jgi:hypothetical protein
MPPEPLVPPTPVVADTEALDSAEFPFGLPFSLAEWRQAARYQSLLGRCHHTLVTFF